MMEQAAKIALKPEIICISGFKEGLRNVKNI